MSGDQKRQRRVSESGDKEQREKRPKIETVSFAPPSSDLAQAISFELSKSVSTKRPRSKSSEPLERNVRAKITVNLSSSNPERTEFLMGTIANELQNISQMLLPLAPRSRLVCLTPSPTSSSSGSYSSPSSSSSSPNYYNRLVARGNEFMDLVRDDSSLGK